MTHCLAQPVQTAVRWMPDTMRSNSSEPQTLMLKRLLALLLLLSLALLAGAVLRTLTLSYERPEATPPDPLSFDTSTAIERFAGAIRIRTVSQPEQAPDLAALKVFHDYLEQQFPAVSAQLRREAVGQGALLYTWAGHDPGLPPAVLMGHMDVVPAGDESAWTQPPFSGSVQDSAIWGRGTLDDKINVLGILEAAEALLAEGYLPQRTLIFAFGGDEENGGEYGARAIAALLARRGVEPLLVLDEGGTLSRGLVPGVAGDVALIGIAEKGYASARLTARSAGGHASMPPAEMAIGILAKALTALQEHPMPARLTPVSQQMFDAIAPAMSFPERVVVTNRWLSTPLLIAMLEGAPSSAAMLRTTTALTMFEAGIKDNVLPDTASAVVNFRLLPGDSAEALMAHIHDTIDDQRVAVQWLQAPNEASPISPTQGPAWEILSRSIAQSLPEAVISPYLMLGASDATHFTGLTPAVYRYSPIVLTPQSLDRIHGVDERIAVDNYLDAVRFYAQFMREAGG